MSVGQIYSCIFPCLSSIALPLRTFLQLSHILSFKTLYSRPFSLKYQSIAESITRRHSGSYSVPSLFQISAKKDCKMLSKSFTGMFFNSLAIPLTFRQVSNRFIHVTVDFIVFLFLFLSFVKLL